MVYYVGNDTNNPVIIPDNMRPIGSGREGVVYNVGGVAVKIVNETSWMTENKIWNLSSLALPKLIMMPMQPIYDQFGKYCGYIMKLLNCTNAEDAKLSLMRCDNLIKSIDFINSDAEYLADQGVALKDTTLRNAVISNTNNLVNVLDPDRYLTMEDFKCYFSTREQFEKENVYWVNRLWYSLFYQMIEQSANFPGVDYRKFRFYMREKLDSAMELRYVPSLIKSEVKDFDTVNDYMVYKLQYTKSKDLLKRY